jgi:SAM-dependent methyltransferase
MSSPQHKSAPNQAGKGTLFNLLGQPEKLQRDVSIRLKNKEINRTAALKFDVEYFDGPREQGYGGYTYDGRWKPVAERLIDQYALTSTSKFLDVGCAKGFLMHDLQEACPGIDVHGLDISAYAKAHAPESVREKITLGNCLNLPYPDNFFDAAVAINTIHNLDTGGCKQAIRELMRVTKHKRRIFVQVDAYCNAEEKETFETWMLTAKTYLRPEEWQALFKEIGYEGDYFWTIIGFGA